MCKNLIISMYDKQLEAFSMENPFPFESTDFESECECEGGSEKRVVEYRPATLRVAYLLLVHEQPEQVIRLIKALDEPVHIFFVHVDLKSPETYRCLEAWAEEDKKVFLVPKSQSKRVTWGGWSVVEATLECIKLGLSSNRPFDFMVLLSGSTYPLQSNRHIRTALAAAGNQGDILGDIGYEPVVKAPAYWHSYVECDDRLHRVGRLTYPSGDVEIYQGAQWWAISFAAATWLVSGSGLPQRYAEYAQHTRVPDEHYFSTMFRHSPFCDRIITPSSDHGVSLMTLEWGKDGGWADDQDEMRCLVPSYLAMCGRSPIILTTANDALLASPALFARKFDATLNGSRHLLDIIDRRRAFDDEAMKLWQDEL